MLFTRLWKQGCAAFYTSSHCCAELRAKPSRNGGINQERKFKGMLHFYEIFNCPHVHWIASRCFFFFFSFCHLWLEFMKVSIMGLFKDKLQECTALWTVFPSFCMYLYFDNYDVFIFPPKRPIFYDFHFLPAQAFTFSHLYLSIKILKASCVTCTLEIWLTINKPITAMSW